MRDNRQSTRFDLLATRIVCVMVLSLTIAFVVVGCGAAKPTLVPTPIPAPTPIPTPINFPRIYADAAVTRGNHSYIPINLIATPDHNIEFILAVLQEFEGKHPEFEVTSWLLENHYNGYFGARPYIYGIWVNHKPKI